MTSHENMPFREREMPPTSEMLERALGGSFPAYEAFQDALPGLELEQDWQWYTPYKAWFAKGQHFWITPHGTRKEKNLYWLYVYDGHFSVAVWFKEKNRADLLNADVNGHTKALIRDAETMGKMPTFPVVFDITSADQLADVYMLLDCKKRLEK